MHNLVGTFIKEEPPESFTKDVTLYPIKVIFPPNKARVYYLLSKSEQERWLTGIKKVIGYQNLFDYYELGMPLGKGKFGLVRSAIHKKTGNNVAVKIMSKKEMTL